jgi:DNA-binding XRE family transcriptional regulator
MKLRTTEQREDDRKWRDSYQKTRPSIEQLVASGDADPPVMQGHYIALRGVVAQLKQERERAGLTLNDVASRSGIDLAALSRLENGREINPTLDILFRYAHALGKRLELKVLNDP